MLAHVAAKMNSTQIPAASDRINLHSGSDLTTPARYGQPGRRPHRSCRSPGRRPVGRQRPVSPASLALPRPPSPYAHLEVLRVMVELLGPAAGPLQDAISMRAGRQQVDLVDQQHHRPAQCVARSICWHPLTSPVETSTKVVGGSIAWVIARAIALHRGSCSRRRDCHSAAPPPFFLQAFQQGCGGDVSKMTVSPTATLAASSRPACACLGRRTLRSRQRRRSAPPRTCAPPTAHDS